MVLPEPKQALVPEMLACDVTVNVAEYLDQQKLAEIGRKVVEGYERDLSERADWEEEQRKITDLMMLNEEEKSEPWPGAANVKYPELLEACLQFSARALSTIIRGYEVVRPKIIGPDPTGSLKALGQRISDYLNWQLMEKSSEWRQDEDKLLSALPARGCGFKKIWWDPVEERVRSVYVPAWDLVLPYRCKNLEKSPRITHRMWISRNKIVEGIRSGAYLDVSLSKLGRATEVEQLEATDETSSPASVDELESYLILEQHTWLDLDGDGYDEPYFVTVEKESATVLNIVARYYLDGIRRDETGRIRRIEPQHYFVRSVFFESADGSVYGIGFGKLIGAINRIINSLYCQILDAGRLANERPVLYDEGSVLFSDADISIGPGVVNPVRSYGAPLSSAFYVVPFDGPSPVLGAVLEKLQQAAERIGSPLVLSGTLPGANLPVGTIMASIEQGLQVFSSVYARHFEALRQEFKRIWELNARYMPDEEGAAFGISRDSYRVAGLSVRPITDPRHVMDVQRAMQAQELLAMRGQGLNDEALVRRWLESRNVEDIEELMPGGKLQIGPSPDVQIEMKRLEIEERRQRLREYEAISQATERIARVTELISRAMMEIAQAEAAEAGQQLEAYKLELSQALEQAKMLMESEKARLVRPSGTAQPVEGGVPRGTEGFVRRMATGIPNAPVPPAPGRPEGPGTEQPFAGEF